MPFQSGTIQKDALSNKPAANPMRPPRAARINLRSIFRIPKYPKIPKNTTIAATGTIAKVGST